MSKKPRNGVPVFADSKVNSNQFKDSEDCVCVFCEQEADCSLVTVAIRAVPETVILKGAGSMSQEPAGKNKDKTNKCKAEL